MKRINLLSQQIVNPQLQIVMRFLRICTFAVGGITVVALGILFYQKSRVETEYQQYLTQKESLINEFSAKQATVQKVQLVALKSKALSNLLVKDPQFKNYYTIFTNTVPISSESATINVFSVNKNKTFSTSVAFNNQGDAYTFMNAIEAKMFQDVFLLLTVDSISVSQPGGEGPAVVVNVSGTFK